MAVCKSMQRAYLYRYCREPWLGCFQAFPALRHPFVAVLKTSVSDVIWEQLLGITLEQPHWHISRLGACMLEQEGGAHLGTAWLRLAAIMAQISTDQISAITLQRQCCQEAQCWNKIREVKNPGSSADPGQLQEETSLLAPNPYKDISMTESSSYPQPSRGSTRKHTLSTTPPLVGIRGTLCSEPPTLTVVPSHPLLPGLMCVHGGVGGASLCGFMGPLQLCQWSGFFWTMQNSWNTGATMLPYIRLLAGPVTSICLLAGGSSTKPFNTCFPHKFSSVLLCTNINQK